MSDIKQQEVKGEEVGEPPLNYSNTGCKPKKLKPWHMDFLQEYLKNGNNGTQAYLTVRPDVSQNTAFVNSSKLLNQTEFLEALEGLREPQTQSFFHDRDKVLERVEDIANRSRDKEELGNELKSIDLGSQISGIKGGNKDDGKGYLNMIQNIIQVNTQNEDDPINIQTD